MKYQFLCLRPHNKGPRRLWNAQIQRVWNSQKCSGCRRQFNDHRNWWNETYGSHDGRFQEAVLHTVLHFPSLFTNLMSTSCLRKKGWYLHRGTGIINRISNNFELASDPIQNVLYVLPILHKTLFAAVALKDTSLKTWHRWLSHFSKVNLKRFANAREIDMVKLREVDQHLLVCKICVLAKQKRKPSYKAQSQPEDICEILHVDLMGPISPTG